MPLSSPTLRGRSTSTSSDVNYAAKARRVRESIDSTSSTGTCSGSTSSTVLRVSKEVENIGARVPMSKKRVTWRFVLAGSEQVHTLMLDHSRLSAKKRLKLDGRRLYTSEHYAANWHYDFHVGDDAVATAFRVTIRDAKSAVVDQRKLETVYDLVADGVPWEHLAERFLPVTRRPHSTTVWSRDMYVRRVADTIGELWTDGGERPPGTLVTWTFAFGTSGSLHKLELRDFEEGALVVVLDCRELHRVSYDAIQAETWAFEYDLDAHHELELVVTLVDDRKTYDLVIDGSPWHDIGETNFVLEAGWYPVYSRSRSAVYFRHDQTGNTQWEKPIVDRTDGRGPKRLHECRQVSPEAQGLSELIQGLHAVSVKDTIHEEPESEQEDEKGRQEVDLLQFPDDAGGPAFQKSATPAGVFREEQKTQPSVPPLDLLSM